MAIPTPQPDGDNSVLPLPSRMVDDSLVMELEMEDDTDDDEVWVLSIRVEFSDSSGPR